MIEKVSALAPRAGVVPDGAVSNMLHERAGRQGVLYMAWRQGRHTAGHSSSTASIHCDHKARCGLLVPVARAACMHVRASRCVMQVLSMCKA